MIPAPFVYALIGAAFLAAGHRAVGALSWRAALALLLLPLAFTGKALLTGGVFGPLDNVRYAIADSTAPAVAGWRRRYHGADASLFENQNVLPRALVPERVRVGGAQGAVLSEIRAERDFRRRAWIELPGEPGTGVPQGRANGAGEVRTWRQGSGYLLDADMRSAGWVVMSVTHWRGWRAALEDGSELPLAFGNHAFLALRLPAGQHRVRLWYRPSSFVWGRAVTVATAAALGALALAHAWRRRRQPRPVSMASP